VDQLISIAREMLPERWVIARVRARGDDPTNYLFQASGRGHDMVGRSNGHHAAGDNVLVYLDPVPFVAGPSPWNACSFVTPATNPDGSPITVSDIYGLHLEPTFRQEVPAGSVDGVNRTFALAWWPADGSLAVYLNGLEVTSEVAVHGRSIVFTTAPLASDTVYVDYIQARRQS